jgi:hypothetical protein
MDTLPQEVDWRIVSLKTHQRHLRSLRHHPLINIRNGELTYGRGSASGGPSTAATPNFKLTRSAMDKR